jgi:hypothetical protein
MPVLVLDEPKAQETPEVKKPRLVLDQEPVSTVQKPKLVLDTENPLPEIVSKESVPYTSPEIKRPIPEIKALSPEIKKNLVKPEGKTQKAETPLAKIIEATVGDKGWDVVRNYLSGFSKEELKTTYGTDNVEDIVKKQRQESRRGVARIQGAAQGALGITPGHPELKQEFPADSAISQVVAGVLPYLIPGGGTVAKFAAIPAAQETVRQVTDRQEQLTPEQRAAKVGTAAAGGAVTGKIFKDADLGKTVLNRILQRSAGAGAASVTENLAQDALSGKEPDAKSALVRGGINAATIGILGAMTEIPQMRGLVMSEGRRIAGKPVSYKESLKLVKQAQLNPETDLSPNFQKALYEQNRKVFLKKLKSEYGNVDDVILEVQQAKGKLQRAQIFDRVGAKEAARARAAGADPSKGMYAELLPYREQIINGADPIDVLMTKRLAERLQPKTQIEQTIKGAKGGIELDEKSAVKLNDDIKTGIEDMKSEISSGGRGRRYVTRDNITGEVINAGYEPSSYPPYFQNRGYSAKPVLNILDKALNGKPLTEKQVVVLDDLYGNYKEMINEERRLQQEIGGIEQPELQEIDRAGQDQAYHDLESGRGEGAGVRLFPDPEEAFAFINKVESEGGYANVTRASDEGIEVNFWYSSVAEQGKQYQIHKEPYEMTREEFKNIPLIKYIGDRLKDKINPLKVAERNQLAQQLVDTGLMSIDSFNAMTNQHGFGGKVVGVGNLTTGKPIPSKPTEGQIGDLLNYIGQWQIFSNIPLFAHRKAIIRALVDGKKVPSRVIDDYKDWGWITADGTTAYPDSNGKMIGVPLKEAVESYGVRYDPNLIEPNLDNSESSKYTLGEKEIAYGSPEEAESKIAKAAADISRYSGQTPQLSEGTVRESKGTGRNAGDIRPADKGIRFPEKLSKIAEELRKRGFVDFRGKEVNSIHDVAEIAAAFRHPLIEQFQVIYLKEKQIMAHQVISSGMPDRVYFKSKLYYRISNAADRVGADEIYFAHNHPSGNPEASEPDIETTKTAYSLIGKRFKGHIVTDSGKFSFISKSFQEAAVIKARMYDFFSEKPDYRKEAGRMTSFSVEGAAGAAKDFVRNNKTAVIFCDAQSSVLSIDSIGSRSDIYKYISESVQRYKAAQYIIVCEIGNLPNTNKLPARMTDVIQLDSRGGGYEVKSLARGDFDMGDVEIEKRERGETYRVQEFVNKNRQGLYKKFYGEAKSAKYSNLGAERIAEKKTAEALKSGSWGVSMPKEPAIGKKVNKTEILSYAEKAFNVPIRGRATHRFKNLAGIYSRREQIVRLRRWGEIEPMTHEIAHHIDAQMKKDLGKHWKSGSASGKERAALYKELGRLDYEPEKSRISEGFAEYMRHYLTTGQAAQKAPLFHKFFTEVFLKSNPDFAKKLTSLKDMIDTWQGQGAENRILAQIDFQKEHIEVPGWFLKARKAYEWFNRNFIDEFYTLRKIEEQMGIKPGVNIRPTADPFTMATYAKSKAGLIARTFVMEKAIDEYGKILGPGLVEILSPVSAKEMPSFIAYGIAQRALNLQKRGIESGVDIEDAKFIVDKYSAKEDWDSVLEGITSWSNHLLDWVIRAGGLGKQEAAIIRELNPIYLPFKRAFVNEMTVSRGSGASLVNRGEAVKSIKGSARPIINPIESLVSQASEMILKAQKINIARLIADLARKEGVGGFISRVPAPMTAQSFTLEKLKSQLEEIGVDLADANLEDMLTVFTQGQQYRGKDNVVSIFRDGKREFYELHPDLYRALSGLDTLDRGTLLKIFSPFARMLRLGATGLKLSFNLVRNPWRDALSYAVLSKHKDSIPILDTTKGVLTEITAKPGDLAWRFKNTGGSLSGMMGFDRAATMSIYDDLINQKLKASKKVIKAINLKNVPSLLSYLLNQVREGLNVFELGPRVAELEKSYKKYIKEHPDWTEEDAFVKAFNDAQDVTVNFTKSGYMGKRINEVTAFFNASVQGANKMGRAIKENPVGFFVKGLAWLTTLTLINWFKIKDKQWYKNLPPDYRYSNFFFEVGEHTILRLPMPFEVGTLFVSLPMAMMDAWEMNDTKYVESVRKIIEGQIPRPWNISMTAPVIQALENKNYFGSPIESRTLENLPVGERKTYNTSKLATALAGVVNGFKKDTISPVKMEYILNQYTGGALRQIPQRDIKETSDIPVLSDILVHAPEKPQRQLGEFYVDLERLKYERATDTLKGDDIRRYYRLHAASALLSAWRKKAVEYDKKGDIQGIRSVYRKIGEILGKVGYE